MILISFIIIAAIIILDQLIKVLAVNYLMPVDTVNLITLFDREVLNLTYCENTGAAFSVFENNALILALVTTLVLVGLIIYMLKTQIKNKFFFVSLAMVIGGGFGNNIDRFIRGFVVDFIDFRIINFAIFNFADICIVLGVIFLLIYFVFIDTDKNKEKVLSAAESNGTDNE